MHVSAQKHFTNAKWNYPCLPVCLHYGFRKVQPEISVLTVDLNTCWEGLSLIVSGSSFHGWVVALAELKHNSFNISDQRDRPVFLVSLQWPITDFLMVADMFYGTHTLYLYLLKWRNQIGPFVPCDIPVNCVLILDDKSILDVSNQSTWSLHHHFVSWDIIHWLFFCGGGGEIHKQCIGLATIHYLFI